jgi:hypothetical protein
MREISIHKPSNRQYHATYTQWTVYIAATKGTQAALEYFLNYCATHPEAEIIYRASDMILTIDSDAAYQVAEKSRSRASGYHYLGNSDGKLFNRAIFILAKIICNAISSRSRMWRTIYECKRSSTNANSSIEELNHPQLATPPIRTDNSTTVQQYNRNNQNQWTWDFTGYKIESNRDNLESFEHQVRKI